MTSYFGDPQPGDMIVIQRLGYRDWDIYVGAGYVVHLTAPSMFPRIGSSNIFMFISGQAVVTKETLREATWGCFYWVSNHLDHQCRPLPVDETVRSAEKMVGDKRTYAVISDNSKRFITELRYGTFRRMLVHEDPRPGDLIEIDRIFYRHWGVYVGDGYVIHVSKTGESASSESWSEKQHENLKVMVKCELLKEVSGTDSYAVNNCLDNKCRPRPVHEIISLAKQRVGESFHYNLLFSNCEHFATELRYGKRFYDQVDPSFSA